MPLTKQETRSRPRKAKTRINRRDFLSYAGAGVGLLAAGGLAGGLTGCAPNAASGSPDATGEAPEPDIEFDLYAEPGEAQILPGQPTQVWRYRGEVVSGSEEALVPLPETYLGPILRLQRGQRVRIHLHNNLDEPTITHWHGLHVPEDADGHPRLVIDPGDTYTYTWTVLDRPSTYWYHPHPHGRTGPQVYRGLAGLILIEEPGGGAVTLPTGDHDLPLVIQDRTFTEANQFSYMSQGMQDRIFGVLGDQILVNGQPKFTLPVDTGTYRLRLLNGSNARIYKLGWRDNRPMTVIGTDGGLLERPVTRPYVMLAPGQRVELWADFGEDEPGTEHYLENRDFSGSGTFSIMRVRVNSESATQLQMPERLSTLAYYQPGDAVNLKRPRTFEMRMARMTWLLNGKTFEMEDVARNERVKLDELEVWEFVNEDPHMAMPHPIHVHNVQFQVMERETLPQAGKTWDEVKEGIVDDGWQDTVLVMPGQRVRLLLRFEDYEGLYLYHCHNLEHEDMGMMRNFRLTA
jgi:FtsP/CotA-like multicopper oxidase with cupredoxin domain